MNYNRREGNKVITVGPIPRRLNWRLVLPLASFLVFLGVFSYVWLRSPGKYEYGKNYRFQYSLLSTAKANDGRLVNSRLFIFEGGETFSSPTESFGRLVTVFSSDLPVNTFRITKRHVPRLAVGGYVFDPGGDYDEVSYNMNFREPQRVIPNVTPQNAPPKR